MAPPCPQAIPEVSPPQQDSDSFEAPFLQQHIQGQVTGPIKSLYTCFTNNQWVDTSLKLGPYLVQAQISTFLQNSLLVCCSESNLMFSSRRPELCPQRSDDWAEETEYSTEAGRLPQWLAGRKKSQGTREGTSHLRSVPPWLFTTFHFCSLTLSHQKALTLCMGRKQTVQFLSIGLLSPAELGAERKEWGGSVLLPKLDCVDAFFFLIVV